MMNDLNPPFQEKNLHNFPPWPGAFYSNPSTCVSQPVLFFRKLITNATLRKTMP